MERTSDIPHPEAPIKSEISLTFGSLSISLLNQGLSALIEQNTNEIEAAKESNSFERMEELAVKKRNLFTARGKLDKEEATYSKGQVEALKDSLLYVKSLNTARLGAHSIVDVRVAGTYLDVIKDTEKEIKYAEEKAGWEIAKPGTFQKTLTGVNSLARGLLTRIKR